MQAGRCSRGCADPPRPRVGGPSWGWAEPGPRLVPSRSPGELCPVPTPAQTPAAANTGGPCCPPARRMRFSWGRDGAGPVKPGSQQAWPPAASCPSVASARLNWETTTAWGPGLPLPSARASQSDAPSGYRECRGTAHSGLRSVAPTLEEELPIPLSTESTRRLPSCAGLLPRPLPPPSPPHSPLGLEGTSVQVRSLQVPRSPSAHLRRGLRVVCCSSWEEVGAVGACLCLPAALEPGARRQHTGVSSP